MATPKKIAGKKMALPLTNTIQPQTSHYELIRELYENGDLRFGVDRNEEGIFEIQSGRFRPYEFFPSSSAELLHTISSLMAEKIYRRFPEVDFILATDSRTHVLASAIALALLPVRGKDVLFK